jgi:hypothetical protein
MQGIHFRLERRRHEKFSFLRRYFTIVKYSGEQPTWENAPVDELLSKEDYAVFQSYLRVTTIDVGPIMRLRIPSWVGSRLSGTLPPICSGA